MRYSPLPRLICTLAICLLSGGVFAQATEPDAPPFVFGVDLSYVNELETCGAVWRHQGKAQDPFTLFATQGATLVRVRLWHTPDWTAYSTLDDVKITLRRAQDAGMQTLLALHYSDNWADVGRQEIPSAWRTFSEDADALTEAVYHYTWDTLAALHADDLTPQFIQVGNETNAGMLSDGAALDWARQATLFNAGINAVRDFAATHPAAAPQIILHVAQPENTDWWFREATAAGITDFDLIGISYYPQWSTFSIEALGEQVAKLQRQFGKSVMIVETGYGWTHDHLPESAANILNQPLADYPFTPAGQRDFLVTLTQTLIDSNASGVIYWEPAWVSTRCRTQWGQGSHWENATFFDFTNDNALLPAVQFFSHPYQ